METGFFWDLLVRLAGSEGLLDVVSAGTAEYDDIEQRVGAETVGSVNRHTGGFTGSVETRNDLVLALLYIKIIRMLVRKGKVRERTESTVMTSPVYFVGIPPTAIECQQAVEVL